jgi:hypothetical protein
MSNINITPAARRRRIKAATMLVAAGGVVAGAFGAAAPANANAASFVAVAYSEQSAKGGVATSTNEEQARLLALKNCQDSGGNHCVSHGTVKNACIAVAFSNPATPLSRHASGTGSIIGIAQRQAVLRNGGGFVVASGCASAPAAQQ